MIDCHTGALMFLVRTIRKWIAGRAGCLLVQMAAMHPTLADSAAPTNDTDEIAIEAYVYLYPLISMDVTRRVMTNVPAGVKEGVGPMNAFHHFKAFPSADFRAVVRPNFDTLYSVAWLDLTTEPAIVSVPDTAGRYYLLPMIDMWTDVFAVPGKRTSGTGAANYALVPPGWKGALPGNVEPIHAPTPYVWVIGRTQTNGPADYEAVHQVQRDYTVTPLSSWGRASVTATFSPDPSVDMKTEPLTQVNTMPAAKYFAYGAELMKRHPPHASDWSQLARLRRIGIEPGKSFDFAKADPSVQAALNRATTEGLQRIRDFLPRMARTVNGWQMNTDTMGVYGNHYLKRAAVALVGLGANQPEDAVYPINLADADGQPLEGGKNYVMHGEKGRFCPVDAFCSLTMYDEDGFPVPNPLNRFAIGDRDHLKFNADGSVDIYISHESPGADKESNWLPSPAQGKLGLTMRLYAPRAEVLDGSWAPPVVKRVP